MPLAAQMNGFDELVNFVWCKQPRLAVKTGADIYDPDTVVRVEDRHRICGTYSKPSDKCSCIARKQRVQDQGREREVRHPSDLPRDFDLLQVVTVDLNKNLHPESVSLGRQRGNETKRLRDHEATRTWFLYRVAHSIEPDHAYASAPKTFEDTGQVRLPLRMLHINVDLLRSEGSPEKPFC